VSDRSIGHAAGTTRPARVARKVDDRKIHRLFPASTLLPSWPIRRQRPPWRARALSIASVTNVKGHVMAEPAVGVCACAPGCWLARVAGAEAESFFWVVLVHSQHQQGGNA
jgi:hypothetical protein